MVVGAFDSARRGLINWTNQPAARRLISDRTPSGWLLVSGRPIGAALGAGATTEAAADRYELRLSPWASFGAKLRQDQARL